MFSELQNGAGKGERKPLGASWLKKNPKWHLPFSKLTHTFFCGSGPGRGDGQKLGLFPLFYIPPLLMLPVTVQEWLHLRGRTTDLASRLLFLLQPRAGARLILLATWQGCLRNNFHVFSLPLASIPLPAPWSPQIVLQRQLHHGLWDLEGNSKHFPHLSTPEKRTRKRKCYKFSLVRMDLYNMDCTSEDLLLIYATCDQEGFKLPLSGLDM